MTLKDLKEAIQSARWFSNVGNAVASPGLLPVTLDQFRRFVTSATRAEFGLSQDAAVLCEPLFADLEWLPTTHEENDPIHGDSLAKSAHEMDREQEFKSVRLDIFRLALASQRESPDQALLKIGASNFNETARMAGRFACRMAASEIVVDRVGFWCNVMRSYHQGHWPFGRAPNEDIAVL